MTDPANDLLFVTGVGPGVGKTAVAAALIRGLQRYGRRVVGMKPIEVGVPEDEHHDLGAPDADWLQAATDIPVPPLVRAPYRFKARALPAIAAARSGIELSLADLGSCIRTACEYGQLVVVDAIGGALTPIASDGCVLDLAAHMGATIVIVAPAEPGVESALLLVLEACNKRALHVAGYVLTHTGSHGLAPDELLLVSERAGARHLATLNRTAPRGASDITSLPDDAIAFVSAALDRP